MTSRSWGVFWKWKLHSAQLLEVTSWRHLRAPTLEFWRWSCTCWLICGSYCLLEEIGIDQAFLTLMPLSAVVIIPTLYQMPFWFLISEVGQKHKRQLKQQSVFHHLKQIKQQNIWTTFLFMEVFLVKERKCSSCLWGEMADFPSVMALLVMSHSCTWMLFQITGAHVVQKDVSTHCWCNSLCCHFVKWSCALNWLQVHICKFPASLMFDVIVCAVQLKNMLTLIKGTDELRVMWLWWIRQSGTRS